MKLDFKALVSDIEAQDREWRELAATCANFYDHYQLEKATIEELEGCGQLPRIGNLIHPAINSVLGHEETQQTQWRVRADDADSSDVADGLNQRLKEVMRLGMAGRVCSNAYKSQCIEGLSWVFVDRNSDPFDEPYIIEEVPLDEIFYDMRARNDRLKDCRWIARRKFMDMDEVAALFPDEKVLLREIKNGWRAGRFEIGEYSSDMSWNDRYDEWQASTQHLDHVFQDATKRKRLAVYEVYYRQWENITVCKFIDGRVVEKSEREKYYDDASYQLMKKLGMVEESEVTIQKMRRKWFIGPHEIDDEPSPHPHNHFPFVPFWGYRAKKNNTPYGLVAGMLDAQRNYNETGQRIKQLEDQRLIMYMPEGLADDKMNASDLQHEANRPDGVIAVKRPDAVAIQLHIQEIRYLEGRQLKFAQDIRDFSGIYYSYSGRDANQASGYAINSMAALGATTLAEINANYELGRHMLGVLVLAHLVEDIGRQKTVVNILDEDNPRKNKTIVLNDDAETGVATNDVMMARYRVVMGSASATQGHMQQVYADLVEMFKVTGGEPAIQRVLLPRIFQNSPIHDKADVIEELNEYMGLNVSDEQKAAMQQQQQQLAAMQMQLEQAMQQAELAKLQAETERLRADAAEKQAQAALKQTEAAQTVVEIEQMQRDAQAEQRRVEAQQILEGV